MNHLPSLILFRSNSSQQLYSVDVPGAPMLPKLPLRASEEAEPLFLLTPCSLSECPKHLQLPK